MSLLDLFRPSHKRKNPAVRLAAIEAMGDDEQESLAWAALNDPEARNRKAAVQRVRNAEQLKTLAQKAADEAVRQEATKRLAEALAREAKGAAEAEAGLRALAGLDTGKDQRHLEAVAREGKNRQVRKAALERIQHAGVFHAIALAEEEDDLALYALERVTRENQLETVAKSAKNRAAREAAKARLRALAEAKKPVLTPEAVHRAKLGLLLQSLEKWAASPASEEAGRGAEEASRAFQQLLQEGARFEPGQMERFRNLEATFRTGYQAWRREEDEKAAKTRREAENREAKEALLAEMETHLKAAPAEAPALVKPLLERYASLSGAGAAEAELEGRRRKAEGVLRAERDRVFREKEQAERRSQEEEGSAARLLELCERAEALAAEPQAKFRAEAPAGGEATALATGSAERPTGEGAVPGPDPVSAEPAAPSAASGVADPAAPTPAAPPARRPNEVLELEKRLDLLEKNWSRARRSAQAVLGSASGPIDPAADPAGETAAPKLADLEKRFDAAFRRAEARLERLQDANLRRLQALLPQLEALIEDPNSIEADKRFKALSQEWKQASAVKKGSDAALQAQYLSVWERFRETQDWLRWSNLREKQALCQKLEALQDESADMALVNRFKALLSEWKSIGPVPADSSEALWDRYRTACDRIYEKCRGFFAELEVERESNLKAKEELCARIEAYAEAESPDWKEATEVVKEAQSHWKTMGAVPKEQAEALWERFRSACSKFFEKRDVLYRENLAKKLELAAEVEALKDSTDWKHTGIRIKEIQEKWKQIGPVPRDEAEGLWQRFHGACDHFYKARKAFLEKLDVERPLNLARKEELCGEAEGAVADAALSDEEKYHRIRDLQAAWKQTGPVPKEMEEPLWERFRKPIDAFFEGRKEKLSQEQHSREENREAKEALCAEAEALKDSTDWKEAVERYKSLQERWKETGPAPREADKALWMRFRSACDHFFGRLKENSQKRDEERETNYRRKLDLCFQVEALLPRELSDAQRQERMDWQIQKLATVPGEAGLQGEAPRRGFSGGAKEGGSIDWREATEFVKQLQREWKKIGPVPRDKNQPLWERFHEACDFFFEERRKALGVGEENLQDNLEQKLRICEEAEAVGARHRENPGEEDGQTIRELQAQWRRIGPVPRAQNEYVWKRFRAACEAVVGRSPAFEGD